MEAQFGCFLRKDYAYLMNAKNKLFVVNKDLARIDIDRLRIDRIGLYFAEVKENHVRLSKEGAALLVRECEEVTNIVSLSKDEVLTYFTGENLTKDLGSEKKLIILEYDGNTLGCAQYKEGIILNFLPKMHRGTVIV